jgi:hypothetical protein
LAAWLAAVRKVDGIRSYIATHSSS